MEIRSRSPGSASGWGTFENAVPDQVAIVEDDVDQRSLLDRGLRLRGFSVASYADRPSARSE